MKFTIEYYYIKSDHILSTPKFDHNEIIDAPNIEDAYEYVESQEDEYGNKFKAQDAHGFQFISHQGAAKISPYIEPTVKIIKST